MNTFLAYQIGVSDFQWLLVGLVVAGVSMSVGCYGERQRRKRHQYFFILFVFCSLYYFIKLYVKIRIKMLGVCMWVSISSTGKVSDGCIRDLRFNPRLYQILIGVLV